MNKWRIVEDKWNLKSAPWSGAFSGYVTGIEEVPEGNEVPPLICWFYRGSEHHAQSVVDAHNKAIDDATK